MTEYWIIYDVATGEEIVRGSGPAGSFAMQEFPEGTNIVQVPAQVALTRPLDLDLMRVLLRNGIDRQAEEVRCRYLTPGSGQAMTYQRKEAEARAWVADNEVPTPMLSGEAAARGLTIADLAAQVIAQADLWLQIGAQIESLRMGGKAAVNAAETLGGLVAAAQVDWDSLPPPQ